MVQFYFAVDYDGCRYDDEFGEAFATAADAEAYGKVVANELGRNNTKAVTVFVVRQDGSLVASVAAERERNRFDA